MFPHCTRSPRTRVLFILAPRTNVAGDLTQFALDQSEDFSDSGTSSVAMTRIATWSRTGSRLCFGSTLADSAKLNTWLLWWTGWPLPLDSRDLGVDEQIIIETLCPSVLSYCTMCKTAFTIFISIALKLLLLQKTFHCWTAIKTSNRNLEKCRTLFYLNLWTYCCIN